LLAAESSTETGEVAAKKSPAVGSGKDDAVWCGGVCVHVHVHGQV
jgi:hypothetical protein